MIKRVLIYIALFLLCIIFSARTGAQTDLDSVLVQPSVASRIRFLSLFAAQISCLPVAGIPGLPGSPAFAKVQVATG
jgi:hypothetical protein